MDHASRISDLMRRHNINQVDLARRSGINQAAISKILLGRRKRIRGETIEKIAKAFRMTVGEYYDISAEGRKKPEKLPRLVLKFKRLIEAIPEGDPIIRIIEDIID